MSTSERVRTLREQLSAHPYEISAGEFVRFGGDGNDDVISGILRAVIAEGQAGCDVFRHGLGVNESDALRLFAMRRTLQGLRQSSLGSLYEAIDGCALMENPSDVPWESWLKAAFFLARSLGGDLPMIGKRFGDLADGDVAARCDVALGAMNRVNSLSQCRLVEVRTNYGVGLIEMLVFRDTTNISLRGAPKLGDHQIEFQPTTNLAQLAASLADALDAAGEAVVGPIAQDQLAATSFSLTVAGSYLPTKGCLSFVAEGHDEGPRFTVLVAELTEADDGDSLVTAAVDTDDQAAIFDAPRLVLLSPQPNFDDDVEVFIDFQEIEGLARTVLIDPATH